MCTDESQWNVCDTSVDTKDQPDEKAKFQQSSQNKSSFMNENKRRKGMKTLFKGNETARVSGINGAFVRRVI